MKLLNSVDSFEGFKQIEFFISNEINYKMRKIYSSMEHKLKRKVRQLGK